MAKIKELEAKIKRRELLGSTDLEVLAIIEENKEQLRKLREEYNKNEELENTKIAIFPSIPIYIPDNDTFFHTLMDNGLLRPVCQSLPLHE